MNIDPNVYNNKNFGYVPVTIRMPFLKKCWVFDLTLAQSNIEHSPKFALFDWSFFL
jgi:hypothetical protein